MQRKGMVFGGLVASVLLGGLVAGAGGCAGPDDAVSSADQAELRGGFPVHRRHFGHDAGSAGALPDGGAGPGDSGTTSSPADAGAPATDCDVCAQASRCCSVVEAERAGCSFSAETCASMSGDARPAYVNACLTYVVSVRGAWSGNPPAECR